MGQEALGAVFLSQQTQYKSEVNQQILDASSLEKKLEKWTGATGTYGVIHYHLDNL